jgi:hypothetical protein
MSDAEAVMYAPPEKEWVMNIRLMIWMATFGI